MSEFMEYLDNFELKTDRVEEKVVKESAPVKKKVVKKVKKVVKKKPVVESKKPAYRIPKKKVVKNKVVESRNHAVDILDGWEGDRDWTPVISEQHGVHQEDIETLKKNEQFFESINNINNKDDLKNLGTRGAASALL
jgi:hypothetical protein